MNLNIVRRWLCFCASFFLLTGAITAHASSLAGLSVAPAELAGHPDGMKSVVEKYYRTRAAGELSDYLDTLQFKNVAERRRAELTTVDIWKSVSLQQPNLQFAATGQNESGTQGVVHFTVDYRLVVTASGETFQQSDENIALLDRADGQWKIRRIIEASDLGIVPQALGEQAIASWQEDLELIKNVLPPDPTVTQIATLPPPLSPPGKPPSAVSITPMPLPGASVEAPLPPALPATVSQTSGLMTVASVAGAAAPGRLGQQDMTAGLLLSYDFTSTSIDKVVEDISGNGYMGMLNGPVWTGRSGLYFDGKDDYIEVDEGGRLHSDSALTVIGEFVTTSYTTKTWQNLVWKGNLPDGKGGASDCTSNCENREFALWLSNGAYLHANSTARDDVGRGQTYSNTPNGSVNGSTVFAQVIDSAAKSMKVFINGKEAASQAYSSSGLRRTDGPLLIGGGGPINKGWNFRGYMRWLRIYNRALTDEEIAAITRRHRPETTEPWRDPYSLDDAVVKGGWATIMPIQNDAYFDKFVLSAIEPGIVIQDGWFSTPTNRQETEIIYQHDGSPLRFSGHATVLDCLDYCGKAGSVELIIRGDDKDLWHSGRVNQREPGKDFDVDLTGVHEIRLVTTDGGNGDGEDWAAWLNLKLAWPDPEEQLGPLPTQAIEPPIAPQVPIQITNASTTVGRVDSVYTLDRKPEVTPLASMKNFPGETEEVVIWFQYQGLEAGDVLTGVWTDIGRQLQLRVVPVVVIDEQGATDFSLRRPVAGWARGNYLVEIKKDDKVLNSAKFNMED